MNFGINVIRICDNTLLTGLCRHVNGCRDLLKKIQWGGSQSITHCIRLCMDALLQCGALCPGCGSVGACSEGMPRVDGEWRLNWLQPTNFARLISSWSDPLLHITSRAEMGPLTHSTKLSVQPAALWSACSMPTTWWLWWPSPVLLLPTVLISNGWWSMERARSSTRKRACFSVIQPWR